MKVYIGPYINWIGPYQIANFLKYIGFSEVKCARVGDYLADTKLADICEWIYSKNKRKVSIHIDRYDTWDCSHTLSLIVLPLLKKYRALSTGSPFVDNEDVPEELHSPKDSSKNIVDENWDKRWEWVLDEMIWAHEHFISEGDYIREDVERIQNGFRLFGKYYRGLWS